MAWTLINQSSVKKLPIAYVHNQSMFLKTSGLNHKWFMLHCLVFKEQLCLSKLAFLLSFESCSLQATFISYRIERSLSRSFFFLFSSLLFFPDFPYFPPFLHYLSEILALFSLFHPPQFLTLKNSSTKILNELAEIGMILDAKRFYAFFLSKLYR